MTLNKISYLIKRRVKVVKVNNHFSVNYYGIGMKGTLTGEYYPPYQYVINWDEEKRYPHDRGWFVDKRSVECVYKNCKRCKNRMECITS